MTGFVDPIRAREDRTVQAGALMALRDLRGVLALRVIARYPVKTVRRGGQVEGLEEAIACVEQAIAGRGGVESGRLSHVYLSTGCLHGEHGYCAAPTGMAGAKKPAVCKFCGAACVCPCHGGAS